MRAVPRPFAIEICPPYPLFESSSAALSVQLLMVEATKRLAIRFVASSAVIAESHNVVDLDRWRIAIMN